MAFLPNIPQATDQLSVTQGNLLNNFNILGAIAGNTNASSASINSTSGFNWIYLPSNGAKPPAGAAFPSGSVGLYSAASLTGLNDLFINKTIYTSGGNILAQIPATSAELQVTGYSYLPSGLLMKWSRPTSPGAGSNTVTFVTGADVPAFTEVYIALITPITVGLTIQVTSLTTTVMTVQCSSAGQFYFLVLGR